MPNKKVLVKSGIWQLLNVFVIVASQFIFYAVMARYVNKAAFGLFAIANAFLNFVTSISEAGMGDALLQRRVVEPQHKNAALFFSLIIALVMYILFYFASPYIAEYYKEPSLTLILRVVGLLFFFLSFGSSSMNLLQKEFKFKEIFICDGMSMLASNVLGVILGIYGYGVWAMIWSLVFYFFSKSIIVWFYEPLPIKIGSTLKHWKDLFNYGMGLTLVRINNYLNNFGITLFIGKLVPINILGVFDRAYRTTSLPVRYLGDMVQKLMVPSMVKIGDDDNVLFRFFYKGLSFSNSMLLPISFFSIVFSKPIVFILLGHHWGEAIIPMQILLLSLPFRVSTKVADALMRVRNLIYKNANRKFQYLIALAIGIWIGHYWGLPGICWGVSLASLQNYLSMILTIRNRVFKKQWQKLIINPFGNGLVLTLCIVPPAYLIYYILMYFVHDEVIAFTVLCVVLGIFFSYAFFKKPKLLGKDFAPIREQLMSMMKKKKKGKNKFSKEGIEVENEIIEYGE
ncbi:MAG: lipopolysaccharide biosynthesis protein [Bacteroidetes bacterium]|nr:lipopolysaccharide biosynthesis protein [Bacteroidota bacterium]